MQIEEKLYPLEGLRHDPAGDEFRQTSLLEESDAPTARGEAWSAFSPASDRLEDILMIPDEPLETVEALVEAEVLEDVFGNNEAPSRMAGAIALPVEAGGVELQATQGNGDTLHTSLLPSEQAADEAALPSVESFRGQAHVYDKYSVGMRILRISPAWLLLSTFGFLSIIILFSWMSRPDVNAAASSDTVLRNEATNRPPAPATAPVVEVAPAAVEPVAEQPAPAPPVEAAAKEVTPAQASPAPLAQEVAPQTAAVETAGNFTVQVGSYPDASRANERVSALRASGVEARAAGVEIPKRGTWYRVQAGRFQTREEATRFGAQLRAKGAADNVIVAEVEKR